MPNVFSGAGDGKFGARQSGIKGAAVGGLLLFDVDGTEPAGSPPFPAMVGVGVSLTRGVGDSNAIGAGDGAKRPHMLK